MRHKSPANHCHRRYRLMLTTTNQALSTYAHRQEFPHTVPPHLNYLRRGVYHAPCVCAPAHFRKVHQTPNSPLLFSPPRDAATHLPCPLLYTKNANLRTRVPARYEHTAGFQEAPISSLDKKPFRDRQELSPGTRDPALNIVEALTENSTQHTPMCAPDQIPTFIPTLSNIFPCYPGNDPAVASSSTGVPPTLRADLRATRPDTRILYLL